MKARVKVTGEIVEVEKTICYCATWTDHKRIYNESDLDFNIGPPHPEATISGWVARDGDGTLFFHQAKPVKGRYYWDTPDLPAGDSMILPRESFPSLTWESDPLEVEIVIKPKNK
ncbi:MAG: hypothetical protein NC212_08565 [Staphylococcus sp.]|nr:hypothetical protein [Staphylococcus sp.]